MNTVDNIVLVTGGNRSGKSAYAEHRASAIGGQRSYIATCPRIDAEMDARIARHRQRRAGQRWHTVEEPLYLATALEQCRSSAVVLVDCLTLWVNNLLYHATQQQLPLPTEEEMAHHCAAVISAAAAVTGTVIFVSNELGMGLIGADAASRRFCDLAGRCNQCIAAAATEVIFVVAGQPLTIKSQVES